MSVLEQEQWAGQPITECSFGVANTGLLVPLSELSEEPCKMLVMVVHSAGGGVFNPDHAEV